MAGEPLDIPAAWEELDPGRWKGILMVIGEVDTGKSTLARYLYGRFAEMGRPVGLIDGDPGQSSLGPPATLSLVVTGAGAADPQGAGCREKWVTTRGFPPAQVCRRSFVGSVTPHGHMLEMLVGAARLAQGAREAGAQAVVYDTCGLVDPAQGGLALKLAKIELLRPEVVIGIQREKELEPLLAPLQRSGKTQVIRLRPSVKVRARSRASRSDYRAEQFARYFAGAGLVRLDWRKIAVFPLPQFRMHGLLALEDWQGYMLALGILTEIDREGRRLGIFTPLDSLEGVRALRLGDMTVDPQTFQGSNARGAIW